MGDIKKQIGDTLTRAINETGRDLQRSGHEIAQFVAERGAFLATLAGQPGFDLAVQAEEQACRIFAGLQAVQQADATDGRLLGMVQMALQIAAVATA